MANLGLKRLNKKLRHQVKTVLKMGGFDFYVSNKVIQVLLNKWHLTLV